MDVQANVASATGGATVAPVTTTTDDNTPISIREAAQRVSARRAEAEKPTDEKPPAQRAANGQFARQDIQSPSETEGDAAPEEVRGETQADVPAEQPPIDPPRSWSKEDKELFSSLPRETQERLAERERLRESDFLRRQNDAADKTKALSAREQAAEQARQQYESALQNTLQSLLDQQGEQFADIKTPADVQKLAADDPFRFVQWQARQQQIHALHQQNMEMQRTRQEEAQRNFVTWADEQDKTFSEQVKEFADPEKAAKAREGIVAYLTEVRGVPKDTLPQLWANPMFRDARMQQIVWDAYRWNDAQQKAKAAAIKPVPPVQRAGTAPSKADANASNIAALEQKLKSATTTRDQIAAAAALRAAKRAAAR